MHSQERTMLRLTTHQKVVLTYSYTLCPFYGLEVSCSSSTLHSCYVCYKNNGSVSFCMFCRLTQVLVWVILHPKNLVHQSGIGNWSFLIKMVQLSYAALLFSIFIQQFPTEQISQNGSVSTIISHNLCSVISLHQNAWVPMFWCNPLQEKVIQRWVQITFCYHQGRSLNVVGPFK